MLLSEQQDFADRLEKVQTKDWDPGESKDFGGRTGASVTWYKDGKVTVNWWSGSHDSSIADAEAMVRALQEAIQFAKSKR